MAGNKLKLPCGKFVISCDGEEQRRAVVAAQVTKQGIELIVIYVGS